MITIYGKRKTRKFNWDFLPPLSRNNMYHFLSWSQMSYMDLTSVGSRVSHFPKKEEKCILVNFDIFYQVEFFVTQKIQSNLFS